MPHFIAITQEGESRIRKSTVFGSSNSSHRTNSLVCSYSSCAKIQWRCQNLCWISQNSMALFVERHILPSVVHLLGHMVGVMIFSKIDAKSGSHQIPLSKRSQLLTTFITLFGRFAYQRLPFGITSSPERNCLSDG